ncbi:MAG: molecular chaperone DnaJ [Clostridia bacterium]|nr:molecular chaperone DnaJ [Clostridia bacterium]
MAKRDYYEVLGVEKTASEAEIKSAYKRAAKKYHPDLHPGDKDAEEKFKEVNEAHEVLSDAGKRAQYDQFGHAAFDPSMGGGAGGAYSGGFGNMGDIFETIFGGGFGGFGGFGGGNTRRPQKGRTLRANIEISFEEAAFGATKKLNVNKEEVCSACSGEGTEPGTKKETCSRCRGRGQVNVQQNTVFGTMSSTRMCEACGGTGSIIKTPCKQCRGSGRVKRARTISIKVPAGIDDGQILNIEGEGEPGILGGPHGDLQVVIRIKPHKQFVRDGYNIYQTVKVPYYTAVLGGEINVETLEGMVKYDIPTGTQAGTKFRLREKGIPVLHSSKRGDMIVTVNIDVPKRLTDEQRECVRNLAAAFGEGADAGKKSKEGIFSKKKGKK